MNDLVFGLLWRLGSFLLRFPRHREGYTYGGDFSSTSLGPVAVWDALVDGNWLSGLCIYGRCIVTARWPE